MMAWFTLSPQAALVSLLLFPLDESLLQSLEPLKFKMVLALWLHLPVMASVTLLGIFLRVGSAIEDQVFHDKESRHGVD